MPSNIYRKRKRKMNMDKRRKISFSNFLFEAWDSNADPVTGKILVTSKMKMGFGWYELQKDEHYLEVAMLQHRFHWLVTIKVKLHSPNNETYFETAEFLLENCLLNDVESFYYETKAELILPLNKSHIVDSGFTARTLSTEALRRYKLRADETNPLQNDRSNFR